MEIDEALSTTASASTPAFERVSTTVRVGGPLYAVCYSARWILERTMAVIDRLLVGIEQRRQMVAPWTISARRFTAADNKNLWNTYDWSKRGEEWTRSAEWKAGLMRDFLEPNIPDRGDVVEIGPGGGRWTEVLRQRVLHLFVVDVSEAALSICRQRFEQYQNIEYVLSDGRSVPLVPDSVDAIWSYDVFVHINPVDARGYFMEFGRILKPGGRAVVHHPGMQSFRERARAWRSDLTDQMVASFARESGLRLVSQSREYVNRGDVLSVFEKPASPDGVHGP